MPPQIEADSLTELYIQLIDLIKDEGEEIRGTLEVRDVQVRLTNPYSRLILEPVRRHSLAYLRRETEWYLSGRYEIDEIGKHAKLWKQVSDDGKTVNSNYGAKIFYEKFGKVPIWARRTQFKTVIDELIRDPDSRRAVMFFSLPHREYHKMSTTKDFPCTLIMQFMIRNGQLNATTYMRSNDLIFGLSNDIPFFSIVQELVLASINRIRAKDPALKGLPQPERFVLMGHLTHNAGSLHVYERHYDKLNYEWPTRMPLPISQLNGEPFPRIINPQAVLALDDSDPFIQFIRS